MTSSRTSVLRPHWLATLTALVALGAGTAAQAQKYPITPQQRATAQQTAESGIPLSELVPNAPDEYTVKRGDTLWAISRMYLRSPWRWPELWGMNISEIKNPHLIYPGQVLYLDKSNGRARLSTRAPGGGGGTIKVSPRVRSDSLSGLALPTLKPSLIEPFLNEPIVVGENELNMAPRIVAARDDRVLMSRNDRAYVRGPVNMPVVEQSGPIPRFRIFRNATPLVDPATGEVLGYEAQYLGKARLERGESTTTQLEDGKEVSYQVPATIDITAAREEIRAGDRLLPEPPRQIMSYAPHAPVQTIENGRIVSIYGNAVEFAAQNQIVAINKGTLDGIASGDVLAILQNGRTFVDKTDGTHDAIKLPNERIGLLMVFRPFDRVSYALILEATEPPRKGDVLVNP